MTTMPTVAIVGVGTTDYLREQSAALSFLAARAVQAALADAGLHADDVDGLVTEGAVMPKYLPEDLLAAACGIRPRFSAQWMVGAAGTVGAPRLAQLAIAAGDASVVVVVQALGGSGSHHDPYSYHAEDPIKATYEMPMGWYGQASYFASMAMRYGHEYGLHPEALAHVSIQSRHHASLTPGAQRPETLDLDGYLASRMISEPLRAPDCALISEGATAYVITSAERARDLRQPLVTVAGVGIERTPANQTTWFTQREDHLTTGAAGSGAQAFAAAGLTPADVDLIELYDCFSITPLLQLEDLGFAGRGEAVERTAAGQFSLTGELPMNTHGGLLAYGFCLGIGHVTEAVRQLRGHRGAAQVQDAEVALVGGLGVPHHATLILTGGG
jgi:acetyl-CoA acetyltransferase